MKPVRAQAKRSTVTAPSDELRAALAGLALQGLLANPATNVVLSKVVAGIDYFGVRIEDVTRAAVDLADALLDRLAEAKPSEGTELNK